MTTQDWLGDIQPLIVIASNVNVVKPLNNLVGGGRLFSAGASSGTVRVLYWTASATSGDLKLNFEPFTVTYPYAPTSSPLTVSAPQSQCSLQSPTWQVGVSPPSTVFAYTTTASGTTESLFFEGSIERRGDQRRRRC